MLILPHDCAVRRAQRLPSRAGVRVPVLMYHAVGDDCWGEESLFVKPEKLEKQLPRVFVPYTRNVKSSACP